MNIDYFHMDLHERIKRLLSEYDLSNRDFAIKCGISQPTFDKKISGLRPISSEVIMATLQNFPYVSAEWLMRGEVNIFKEENATLKERRDLL